MKTTTQDLLTWLSEFQNAWLLENISNDNHLIELIKTKLHEFEQLINEIHDNDEEYHRAKLLHDDSSNNSDIEQIAIASTSIHEPVLETSSPASPDIHLSLDNTVEEEEHARQILLAESDTDEQSLLKNEEDLLTRPTIRLQRIAQADAELYIPSAWKTIPLEQHCHTSDSSTSHAQEPTLSSHIVSNSIDSDNVSNDETNIRQINNDVTNDNSSVNNGNSESSTSDDDFNIKVSTRKSSTNKNKKRKIKLRPRKNHAHKKNHDIIINYNLSPASNEASLDETPTQKQTSNNSLDIVEEINPINENSILSNVIENNDIESIVESLHVDYDKPIENSPNEPVTNNEDIDSLPILDSLSDRPPVEIPSYAYLLHDSKLSLDSDDENLNNDLKKSSHSHDKNSSNNTKRTAHSSSNSDSSIIKKKSKTTIKQRAPISTFLSSSDNESNSSYSEDEHSSRIHIQRSSSSDNSNINDDISNKISRKRRRKSDSSNERSMILKEIQRKTKEKKISTSTRTNTSSENSQDNQNNKSHDSDETDNEISPIKRKIGRKNIRKIIDDQELHDQTKTAIEAERERRNRIAEKQKLYNDTLLDQSSFLSTSSIDGLNSSNTRLILEIDKTTNEPLIEVSPKIVEQLKPHQHDGIRFLWNNVFESIDAIKNKKHHGNGCILAHCMGLGKTLQVISFIHTAFNYDKITNVKTCLVLCPINAALNWSNEFDHWLTNVEPPIDRYQLTTVKPNLRVTHLEYWHKNGGVAIIGYEMYRRLANGFGIKNKKLKADAYGYLVDPGPDIVVADEGHILKNAQTALAKCLSKIKTPRRIVLTGTPLQNNLIEYYCMVSFIKPNLLGSQSEYINRFVNPIQNGQHRDSNEEDVRLMKRRACVLHELLTGFVDRKDYSLLQEYLPPKFEYIINIRLSDLQSKLYETYIKQQVDQGQRSSVLQKDFKSAKLFADYQYLQKIWTHPFLLYPHFIDRWKKKLNTDDESLIDDNELAMLIEHDDDIDANIEQSKKKKDSNNETNLENAYSGFLIENIKYETEESKFTSLKGNERHPSSSSITTLDSNSINEEIENDSKSNNLDNDIEIIRTYPTRSRTSRNNPSCITIDLNGSDLDNDPSSVQPSTTNDNNNIDEPWLAEMREQFWFPFLDELPKESKFDVELSGKFLLLKFIIDKCAEIGDKILLFSRSLYALNFIESFLKYLHIENEKVYQKQCESKRQLQEILASNGENDNIPNEYITPPVEWIRDRDYFRMDGQTEVLSRKRYAKAFNDLSNPRARLFLISTLAGGIGINLTASNRVIVFDASWNPSHDTQAIFRSYRFGQKKPVYIYRLLAHGTMEEKIYQRQVVKQSISQRVVDDHQLDRHFTQNDIKELYKFKPEPLPPARSTSTLLTQSDTDFSYPIPKDHLLLDLLYEHSRWIHSYHSHDSLLENKLDEGLTTEERRRALEEYENLKRVPDARQIAMQRIQQQQHLNALIAQQRQLSAATTQPPRNIQQNLQQLYEDIQNNLQNIVGQNFDFSRLVQQFYNVESLREGANNNGSTSNSRRTTNAGPVNIRPRPTPATITNFNANDIILVESDDEFDDVGITTLTK